MSDLADLLADPDFTTGDYTVTRRAAPTLTGGVAVTGATTTFATGPASLQPLDGADLQLLPEGIHASDTRQLWTAAALRIVPVPDLVTIDGEAWRVVGFKVWSGLGGAHQIAILARGTAP